MNLDYRPMFTPLKYNPPRYWEQIEEEKRQPSAAEIAAAIWKQDRSLWKLVFGLPMMAYTTPTTRATNDLITASIWNIDVVDNIKFLHDRVVDRWFPMTVPADGSTATRLGNFPIAQMTTSAHDAHVSFDAPANFASLSALEALFIAGSTATITYGHASHYGAAGEAYTTHSGSGSGINLATTANNIYAIDISGLFSSLAANDVCGYQFNLGIGVRAHKTIGKNARRGHRRVARRHGRG